MDIARQTRKHFYNFEESNGLGHFGLTPIGRKELKFTMRILKRARTAARKLLGPRLTALCRRHSAKVRRHSGLPLSSRSKRGLEIGGPSSILAATGPYPFTMCSGLWTIACTPAIQSGPDQVGTGNIFVYHPANRPARN